MKKFDYRLITDIILLTGLAVLSALAVAPETFVMPSSLQMLIIAVVLGAIATFLVFLWREQPSDEREASNQALASRAAYSVGAVCLILSLIVQGFQHSVDPAVPLTLLAMIATKLIVQRTLDT